MGSGNLKIIDIIFFDLYPSEAKLLDKNKSAPLSELHSLALRCANTAETFDAQSWSIFPIMDTHYTVYVEFYNKPKYGLCHFNNIYGKYYDPDRNEIRSKQLWFEPKPIPEFLSPSSEFAVKDRSGKEGFDPLNPR